MAGPRITIQPVAGVPLLHVEEPRLSGSARLFKKLFDRVGAGLALVVLSPVMLVIALVVRSTSRGPALFRQDRVGCVGQQFSIRKFRTRWTRPRTSWRTLSTSTSTTACWSSPASPGCGR